MLFCIVELCNSQTLNPWQDNKVVSSKRKRKRTSLGYKVAICFKVPFLLIWIKKSHLVPNTHNSDDVSPHWAKAAPSAAHFSDAFRWVDVETKSTFVQELSYLAPAGWEDSDRSHLRVSRLPVGWGGFYGIIVSSKPHFAFYVSVSFSWLNRRT